MTFKEKAPSLFDMGYPVLPASGKRILIEGWTAIEINAGQVNYWASNGQANSNVGIRTGDDSIGVPLTLADIDITDRDVCRVVSESVEATFGATIERRGMAPKRGLVYAMDGVWGKLQARLMAPNGKEHKVEWLARGQQFIAFGTHPDTKKPYTYRDQTLEDVEPWELPVVTESAVRDWMGSVLPGLLPAGWSVIETGGSSGSSDDVLANYKPRVDLDTDGVRRHLEVLDPDMGHDPWVAVGMALHHQYGGSDEGFELWDTWSQGGTKYDASKTKAKWRSFDAAPTRMRVTFASVIKMAHDSPRWAEREKAEKIEAVQSWEAKLADCQDQYEVADLCKQIAQDDTLIPIDRAKLADVVKTKLKGYGVNLPIAQVRGMVYRKTVRPAGGVPMEDWCEPYVWCKFEDCFIHVPTQEAVSVQSFNAHHGRDVKGRWMTPDGFQMTAVQVALQELQIPVVARRMYLPWALERFSMDGLDYLNTYRPSSVPDAAASWQGSAAVSAVTDHLEKLIGFDEAKVLIQWMAYCVQNPGRKIRWSPLIKGIEGDGKSLIGEIMSRVMGRPNVRTIAPKVLLTDFNGYAEGACVGVLEELKMAGHNRHDAANALKPNVTNDTIDIHRKGLDPYNIINTMNYIGFTNHGDALPLTDNDRRWWVLFSHYTDSDQLPPAGYFDKLFDLIRNHSDELRAWLLDVDLTGFNPNGRAPDSAAKASMVAAGLHEEDEIILEVIAAGVVGVSKDVVSTAHLTNHISMTDPNLVMKTRSLAMAMTRLGYVKVSQKIKWKGTTCRVWVKDIRHASSTDHIRHLLDSTVGDDSLVTEDF